MSEDLLHFIWKYKRVPLLDLSTSDGELVSIIDVGTHNHLSGPDFFNARVEIGGQHWAGNVEIHIKSSDWYAHEHEEDPNYQNVILHVVWEDDISVFRKDGSVIPTVELEKYVSPELLTAYQNLFDKKKYTFINCEATISGIDDFVIQNWIERLYLERLERKSVFVFELLQKSKNDWDQVLFSKLLKNFGLKINGEAFGSLSNALEFTIVRKLKSKCSQLESLFYGMSHLLDDDTIVDSYYVNLKKEFEFLQHKYHLENVGVLRPEFFRLRPSNFPTIRLSQLANLYKTHNNFFDKVINANSMSDLYLLFGVAASFYWNDHFTFGKVSKKGAKKVTKKFIDLLIINTILPLKFCYSKYLGKDSNDEILRIISQIHGEQNSIVTNFKKHDFTIENAKESQAILQLYNEYCTKNRCLECAIGNSLLKGND